MGIIGVVAALTLPNLNSSTGDKEKVAKVKKIYSNLNDAMGRAIAVYGPFNEWGLGNTIIAGRLTEFMKISKDCGTTATDTCFKQGVKTSSGNSENGLTDDRGLYTFTSADGTGFAITSSTDRRIYIDIDGSNKGANAVSKDVFGFAINNDTGEITPMGMDLLSQGASYLSCSCFNSKEATCTAWVIQYDNMDYLKCPGNLTDNNTSCK